MDPIDLSRLILDHVAVGIFTVDTDFRITFFNDEAERLTGFSRAEAMGRRCADIFRADACGSDCALRRALATGAVTAKRRVRMRDRQGNDLPVEITASVLRDEQGRVIGAVESFLDDSARTILEQKVRQAYTFQDITGSSKAVSELFEVLPTLAESDVAVLVQGETGTGKGLVAQAMHNASRRKGGPFVKVNCAALPETLLESELFGYRKGAFTDAKQDKPGRFEQAHGGTVFLDEIGELPLNLQAKLLQVLEDGEFHPLGAAAPVRVDVRVVAASNRELGGLVNQGLFRKDLYYRLKVAVVELPPLRERGADVLLLASRFIAEFAAVQGKDVAGLEQGAAEALMQYDYPGNVRELKNILEYGVALCPGSHVRLRDLPTYLALPRAEEPPGPPGPESAERERILWALRRCQWNKTAAANLLGMSRTTLWRRMRRLAV